MKQKKVLILFAILINIGSAFCQRGLQNLKEYDYDQYHFGFLLGVNQMGFSMKTDQSLLYQQFSSADIELPNSTNARFTSAEPKMATGFTIGIIGNLRLSDHLDLRFIPALSFGGDREIEYKYETIPLTTDAHIPLVAKLNSTLLEFPLNLKYKGNRIDNARPYILGGIKYARDLSSNAKKDSDNLNNKLNTIKLNQNDLYGELGAGFDFYFDWFKMGLEAKMSYGLKNVLVHDANSIMYSNVINRLNSKIFQLSVTFE